VDRNGTPVLVDTVKEIEAHRRGIMRVQAHQRLPAQVKKSLEKIVEKRYTYNHEDHPVTWFRIFKDKEPSLNDFKNPFAQD